MRDECRGCVLKGKSIVCASYDLRWAIYDLKCNFPFFFGKNPEPPEPCYLREVEEPMQTKYIQIEGAIEIPADLTFDDFSARFEQMLTDKGWHLLAFTKEVEE